MEKQSLKVIFTIPLQKLNGIFNIKYKVTRDNTHQFTLQPSRVSIRLNLTQGTKVAYNTSQAKPH